MKTGQIILSIIAACGMIATAQAEPPTGSRLGNRLKPLANPSFRDPDELSQRTAQCAASLYSSDVKKVFEATTLEDRTKARNGIGLLERCSMSYLLGGEGEVYVFNINPPQYDGMLGEEMVKEGGQLAKQAAMPPEPDYNRTWFGLTGRPIALDDMAVCMVYIAPREVGALFSTRIKSKDENAAVNALVPAMGQCLQQGVELHADARAVRTALGEAMYRRIYAPESAAPVVPASDDATREGAE